MNIDYDEVSTLLGIVEKSNGHPPMKNIHEKAYGRLIEISASLVDKSEEGEMIAGRGPGELPLGAVDGDDPEAGHQDSEGDDTAKDNAKRPYEGPVGDGGPNGDFDASATALRRL